MPERWHFRGQRPTFASPWHCRYALRDPLRAHLVVVMANFRDLPTGPRTSHIDLTIVGHGASQPHADLTKAASSHQPAPHHPVLAQDGSAATAHTPAGRITHTGITNGLSGEVHVGKERRPDHRRGRLATFWRPKR